MADQPEFEGRTVAVTGAAGFIGDALCRGLVAAGAQVRGLDVAAGQAARVEATGAEFRAVDVTDPGGVRAVLEGVDAVVHAAAHVHEWGTMEDFVAVNVGGTANVLDAAEAVGADRAVHVSSVAVYGYHSPAEQDEAAHPRAYGIPYIDTKAASDRLARRRGAVVVRPGDVYGPGGKQWILRPLEMAKAGRLAVPARGEGAMLPIYVDDLVAAILLALAEDAPGEAYTVWQDEPVTFGEHFDRVARMAAAPAARRLPPALLRVVGAAMEGAARLRGESPAFTARAVTFVERRGTVSTAKARHELGWEPQTPYDEGMRRTEEWLRAEGLL